MNSYKKLLNNSIIFAIGNLGSKIIGILMVPLYTYYFTTADYGRLDLITTTVNLIVPICTLSIFESAFRFAMDKSENPKSVLTNSLLVTIIGIFILILLSPFFNFNESISKSYLYVLLLISFQSIQVLLAQFVRAVNYIRLFSINGIIMAISLAGLNIISIVYLKMGLNGYLLSLVLSNLLAIIIFIIFGKLWKFIDITLIKKDFIYQLLLYSIPLIPNTFLWWLTNVSNRYFIVFFLGASANGLFAVANKIPTLLSMLNSIFTQAWQISAVEEFDKKDKNFYSDMFNVLAFLLFFGSSMILVVLKPVFSIIIANSFYESWKYVPVLLLSVIYSSFSNFYGVNYLAAKKTIGVLKTTIYGGVVNIILNIILIPMIGLNGAGLATMLSFFVIWLLRIKDSKNLITINIDMRKLLMMTLILFLQIVVLYLNLSLFLEVIVNFILCVSFIFVGRKYFILILKKIGVNKWNN
ncbi:MAG: oligosaccharide flippase family protein [Bacilli bacterium]